MIHSAYFRDCEVILYGDDEHPLFDVSSIITRYSIKKAIESLPDVTIRNVYVLDRQGKRTPKTLLTKSGALEWVSGAGQSLYADFKDWVASGVITDDCDERFTPAHEFVLEKMRLQIRILELQLELKKLDIKN